jgi:ketosteroid isomerase-like protein
LWDVYIVASCNFFKKENKETFDMAAAKKSIEEQSSIFTEAMNKSDSVSAANCYTTDTKFMQPNTKAIVGRNNILHVMSGFMNSGMPKFSLNTIEVWGNRIYWYQKTNGHLPIKMAKK